MDTETSEVERSEVLVAMTGVAERHLELNTLQEILPALLADPQPQVRREAIASMRKLKVANAQLLMVQHLEAETEVVLQKSMLAVIGASKAEGVLEPLLNFTPSPTLREAYGKALVVQIGSDFARLDVVSARLVERFDREFSFLVVRTFPLEGLTAEQRLELDRKHATAVWEWLMLKGTDNGNASYAADAVTRLRDLMALEPESLDWPVYLIEIELQRGQVASVMSELLELIPNPKVNLKRKWEIGCAALLAIDLEATPGLSVQGRALIDAMATLGGPDSEYKFLFEQMQEKFVASEPEVVESPPTPEPLEETFMEEAILEGEPKPAGEEAAAESSSAEASNRGADPASEPAKEEPGALTLEKPA
jgi:hypothetical protein